MKATPVLVVKILQATWPRESANYFLADKN